MVDLAKPEVKNWATEEELLKEVQLQEEINRLRVGLPFKYGWKWYKWARAFFDSTNKFCLLTAANQVSKSSSQIRKCIEWATNKDLWPELWIQKPTQFWYFYPSQEVVNIEFKTKWSQFLPRNEFKEDPVYGWKELKSKKGGDTTGIEFFSGVVVYFRTYSQKAVVLQSSTVDAIFCDEELPIAYFDELRFRLTASNGYFNMVFTATLGQDFWRRAMEPREGEEEALTGAFKQTVSMYDCLEYEDGSKSHWTVERIRQIEKTCSSEQEVQRRVHGKFIIATGRLFSGFVANRHIKPRHHVPRDWHVYVGADIGSGGEHGHPSAITYVAVKPDYTEGRVFLGWRGDKIQTTAGDVVYKNIELKKKNNIVPVQQFYDYGSRDFKTVADSVGESFTKADKARERGIELVNTLFQNDMLFIYEDPELSKLCNELSTLQKEMAKNHAADDFADSLRYAVSSIPWNFSKIGLMYSDFLKVAGRDESPEETDEQRHQRERRYGKTSGFDEIDPIEEELEEWNDQY